MNATDRTSQRVAELIDRLSRLTRELQYVDGLNPAQWEALRFISRANRYSRTPSALAEFLGTTKGTTSQTLIALENRGFIRRVRDTNDRRVVNLELTDQARNLLTGDPVLKIETMVDKLGPETGATLVRGLSRLLRDMQREVGAKEFGVCELCSQFQCAETAGQGPRGQRCGLTGENMGDSDLNRICVNFKSTEDAGEKVV